VCGVTDLYSVGSGRSLALELKQVVIWYRSCQHECIPRAVHGTSSNGCCVQNGRCQQSCFTNRRNSQTPVTGQGHGNQNKRMQTSHRFDMLCDNALATYVTLTFHGTLQCSCAQSALPPSAFWQEVTAPTTGSSRRGWHLQRAVYQVSGTQHWLSLNVALLRVGLATSSKVRSKRPVDLL